MAGNIEGDFQLYQRLPNIRRRNGAERGTAFIEDNISLTAAKTPFRQPQQSGSPKSECGRVVSMGPSNPDPSQTGQSRGPVYGATSPTASSVTRALPSFILGTAVELNFDGETPLRPVDRPAFDLPSLRFQPRRWKRSPH
jgi:hypothetical protein